MSAKIPVAVVGATGLAGQQFVAALGDHPLFEVARIAASARSAGKPYGEAIREPSGQRKWYAAGEPDERVCRLVVEDAASLDPAGLGLIFSAVDSDAARELEPRYAAQVPVVSTASAFRTEPDVPILVPGVNLGHIRLLDAQRRRRGWRGFITPNPNCTTTGLVITLAPLHARFGVARVLMTSLQACSGAGRSPGVIGLDIIDNVIPYISGEEEKVQRETQKILGTLAGETIAPASFAVSCTCTRVPVLEGHTEAVFVELEQPASQAEIEGAWRESGAELAGRSLPSAPKRLIHVQDDPYRPQPRFDRDAEDGMATTVGRLRPDQALARGWKYVLVSHNTKMGAAKGAILTAEALVAEGYIGR